MGCNFDDWSDDRIQEMLDRPQMRKALHHIIVTDCQPDEVEWLSDEEKEFMFDLLMLEQTTQILDAIRMKTPVQHSKPYGWLIFSIFMAMLALTLFLQ